MIMAGASLAIGAYGAAQQRRAAKAAANQNTAFIQEDYSNQILDMVNQRQQVADDAAQQESARVRDARSEAATIATIAGEYGDGNNTARLQNAAELAAAEDVATIRENRDRQVSDIGRGAEAASTAARHGVAAQQRSVPGRSGIYLNTLGTGLQIASQYNRTRPTSTPPAAKPKGFSYGYNPD